MSHFSVFVIGDNVERQLAPYHEFECTGVNDEFVKDEDGTAEAQEKGLDWFSLSDLAVTDEADLDLNGEHAYGWALVDTEGRVLKAVRRTNPEARWDWYQIGGRWSDFLKLKPGAVGERGSRSWTNADEPEAPGYADSALVRDVDFDGMRVGAATEAAERWDAAHKARDGKDWLTWEYVRDTLHPGDIDAARKTYHEQPALTQFRKNFDESWDCDRFLTPRDEFVRRARDGAVVPFAVVMDGKWYERGSMGWWGIVTGEQDRDEWNRKIAELLDGLAPDTRITVVDCHI